MKNKILERFLRYVKIDTEADEMSDTFPSSEKQKDLGRLLTKELTELGVDEVYFDETYGYVYAKIAANDGGRNKKTIAFIAHMDTAPAFTGKNVNPCITNSTIKTIGIMFLLMLIFSLISSMLAKIR